MDTMQQMARSFSTRLVQMGMAYESTVESADNRKYFKIRISIRVRRTQTQITRTQTKADDHVFGISLKRKMKYVKALKNLLKG